MNAEDISGRLKQLEETISSLEYQQDCCRPFIKLAEIPLGDLDSSFKSFLSQVSEMESSFKSCQSILEDLTGKSASSRLSQEQLIKDSIAGKEDLLQKVDQQIQNLEKTFKQIEKHNPIDISEIHEKLSTEVQEILSQCKEKYSNEKVSFHDTLEKAQKLTANQAAEVESKFKDTGNELEDFEIKYHEYINKTHDPRGEKMGAVLASARSQISEYVSDCKIAIDCNFREVSGKFNKSFEHLRKLLQDMEGPSKTSK